MNRLLSWLSRVTTPRRVAVLLVLDLLLLGCENLLDFPLSVPFMRRTTGHPYLDMCAFCSAPQIQAQLDDFAKQLADLKAAQTSDASDIITLKAPPSGGTVVTTLANGKPSSGGPSSLRLATSRWLSRRLPRSIRASR